MVSSSVRSTRSRTPTRIATSAVKARALSTTKKGKTPPRITGSSTPKPTTSSKKGKSEPKSTKRKSTVTKGLFEIEEETPKKKVKTTSKSSKKDTEKKSKATKTPKVKSDTTDSKGKKKKRVSKKDLDASLTSVKSRADSPSKKSNTSLNGSLISSTSSSSLNETQPGNWGWFSCTVM